MQFLDLCTPIQVRTGDYKMEWKDAKITSVSMETVNHDENDNDIQGLSFSVEFADGMSQRVTDAFGFSSEEWRYKEKCCQQCKWCIVEGGDIVPYGATTATLHTGYVCDCPNRDENLEDNYDETDGGKDCKHHEYV